VRSVSAQKFYCFISKLRHCLECKSANCYSLCRMVPWSSYRRPFHIFLFWPPYHQPLSFYVRIFYFLTLFPLGRSRNSFCPSQPSSFKVLWVNRPLCSLPPDCYIAESTIVRHPIINNVLYTRQPSDSLSSLISSIFCRGIITWRFPRRRCASFPCLHFKPNGHHHYAFVYSNDTVPSSLPLYASPFCSFLLETLV
jgi:hypothetical protein